jgi:hypothetical protein
VTVWVALGGLVLLMGVCTVAVAVGGGSHTANPNVSQQDIARNQTTPIPDTPTQVATVPTAPPTPKPAQAPSQRDQALAYTRAVTADTTAAVSGFNDLGTSCGAGDVNGCRAALISLQTNLGTFQHDLDAHPSPPCLKDADREVRQGLSLYQQGAPMGVDGIDQGDNGKITQGGDLMNQANTHFTHASALVQQANCN